MSKETNKHHEQNKTPVSPFDNSAQIHSLKDNAGVVYSALDIVFELGEYNHTAKNIVKDLFEQQVGVLIVSCGGIAVSMVGVGYLYGAYTGSYKGSIPHWKELIN